MSRTIDERVVQMEFDNASFERNARTTLGTLDKLKQSLNFSGSKKGLEEVTAACNNMDFSNIESGVQRLSNRFSLLGITGMTAVANIANSIVNLGKKVVTAIPKQIMTGGWTRATNIENAKFQLEGLKVAWDEISEDLDYGVKDTAYGLDEAAVVAAQLVASQVQVGDQMKQSLRAVSGVAAMTNSTYGDIGRVFTTVAGQGRLMADQLNQLAARGLNAAATLANYLGKTEAEVREMTSKGEIDFATFAAAMDEAFGAHAKEANKTFNGAFSNMKAALNRIGADFAMPLRDNMRDVFNSITPVINAIRKGLAPTVVKASEAMKAISTRVVFFMNALAESGKLSRAFWTLDIFPVSIVEQMRRFEKTLATIKGYFRLSTASVKDFKDTLGGLKAIFGIVGSLLVRLANTALRPLADFTLQVAKGILSITGYLGRLAISAEKSFRKMINTSTVFETLSASISGAIRTIAEFISNLKILEKLQNIKIELPNLKEFFSGLSAVKIANGAGNAVITFFTSIGKALAGFAKSLNLGGALQSILDGSFIYSISALIMGISRAINRMSGGLLNDPFFAAMKTQLITVFRNLNIQLTAMQQNLKANVLLKIAAAIGIMAASVALLAGIDSDRLAAALGALGGIAAIFGGSVAGFFKVISSLSLKDVYKIQKLGDMMIKLSIAVLILSNAVKKLGEMKLGDVAKGLVALGGSMFILVKGMEHLAKNTKGLRKIGFTMIELAVAIRILAGAVEKMGNLGFDKIINGLVGLGGVMVEIALFSRMMSDTKIGVGTGLAIIEIAAAMTIFAKAAEMFGNMEWEQLGKAGAALGGIIVALTALAAISKTSKSAFGVIGDNLASVGKAKSGLNPATASSILIIAGAMVVFAKAAETFGKMDWGQLGKAGAAIGGLLVIIGAFSKFASGTNLLAAAGALLVIAAALNVFVPAMAAIATMKWGSLLKVGVAMAGIFAIVAAFGALPITAAASVALIAASIGVLGAGIAALVTSLIALSAAGTAVAVTLPSVIVALFTGLANGIVQFIKSLGSAIPALATSLIEIAKTLIVSFCTAISESVSSIEQTFVTLIDAGIRIIGEKGPEIIEAGWNLLKSFLESVRDNVGELVKIGADTVINFLNGIAEKLPEVIQSGVNLILSFLEGIEQALNSPDNLARLENAITGIITGMLKVGVAVIKGFLNPFKSAGQYIANSGLAKGIKDKASNIKNHIRDALNGAIQAVRDKVNELYNAGRDFIQGLINGIRDKGSEVGDETDKVAAEIPKRTKGALREQSPSKLATEFGQYWDQGLINGMNNLKDKVGMTSASVGTAAVDAMATTLSAASDVLNTDTTFTPTITPVIDSSNVSYGIDALNSMLSNTKTTADLSTSISGEMDANGVVLDYIDKLDKANSSRNGSLLEALNGVREDITRLNERIDQIDIVLDSGEMVGALGTKVDKDLGRRTSYRRRGM